MNVHAITGSIPFIVLAVTAIAELMVLAAIRSHALTAVLTLTGLLITFVSLRASEPLAPLRVSGLLLIDGYALYFIGLIVVCAFVTALLAFHYLAKRTRHPEEFYLLVLTATLGASILVATCHWVSFFLGLELLSTSLYTMIAYTTERDISLEASIKYLVLAAVSSAFLLFGIAIIYAVCGTMQFDAIVTAIRHANGTDPALLMTGFCLVLVGLGFKLGLVPFHMWMPDVYEGAPAPVTGFLATVSKAAVFALLFRYFGAMRLENYRPITIVFMCISIVSMSGGNLLALRQTNVKRLLAYSSIAHMGYLLVAVVSGGKASAEAILFYFAAYVATSLAAFGIVTLVSVGPAEIDMIEGYRGLFWRRPWLAALFSTALFSLAGIPLTAGFFAKYVIVASGVRGALWALVIVLAVNSAIGLYYYLRIIVAMYADGTGRSESIHPIPAIGTLVMGSLAIILLFLGVYPGPFMNLIHSLVTASVL